MAKRRQHPADKPEPRPPMTPGEVATAAFSLAVLQVHDDGGGDSAAYEMMALLALESLAMLAGRDLAGFEHLVEGLKLYARIRSTECIRAAMAGQRPSPLGQVVTPPSVH